MSRVKLMKITNLIFVIPILRVRLGEGKSYGEKDYDNSNVMITCVWS